MESLKSFWVSIVNILKSRFKKETGESWVKERREICKTCPHNSLNNSTRTFKQKTYKLLSDFYTWLTRAENEDLGDCLKCGCNLYFKSKIDTEVCHADGDKWKSVYIPNKAQEKKWKK